MLWSPRDRSRPVPSLTRMTDLVTLFVIWCEILLVCYSVLGIREWVSLVTLSVGWLSQAAERLVRVRRTDRANLDAGRNTVAIVVAGSTPWLIFAAAQQANPAAAIWQPAAIPAAVRLVGAMLAVAVIFMTPFARKAVSESGEGPVPRVKPEALLLMGAMLLMSSTPVAVLLCLYWLALTLVPDCVWQRAARITIYTTTLLPATE